MGMNGPSLGLHLRTIDWIDLGFWSWVIMDTYFLAKIEIKSITPTR